MDVEDWQTGNKPATDWADPWEVRSSRFGCVSRININRGRSLGGTGRVRVTRAGPTNIAGRQAGRLGYWNSTYLVIAVYFVITYLLFAAS